MSDGSFTLHSEHGLISITDTAFKHDGPALLLIHGNSSSSEIWRHIQESESLKKWRIVAFDLPGHGASSNAPGPDKSYSMGGYAELAKEVLEHLNIKSVVVLGWSLGGHIGIELIPLLQGTDIKFKGLMMVGSAPAQGLAQTNRGFTFEDGHMSFAAKINWTEEAAAEFARVGAAAGKPELFEQWMDESAKRTDGRARHLMWKKFAEGVGADQRKIVEETEPVLVAVVNGGDEPYINLEYLDEIKWKRLWKGKCLRLEGLKHAPFWEKPKEFEGILEEFIKDCEKV